MRLRIIDLARQLGPLCRRELRRARLHPGIRHDFHKPAANDIKRFGRIELLEDQAAGRDFDQLDPAAELREFGVVEFLKNRQPANVIFQDALRVNRVHPHFVGRVAVQHVEHVAQHLQHVARFVGHDRRRSGSAVDAAHLAKEIRFVQRSHLRGRADVRTINRDPLRKRASQPTTGQPTSRSLPDRATRRVAVQIHQQVRRRSLSERGVVLVLRSVKLVRARLQFFDLAKVLLLALAQFDVGHAGVLRMQVLARTDFGPVDQLFLNRLNLHFAQSKDIACREDRERRRPGRSLLAEHSARMTFSQQRRARKLLERRSLFERLEDRQHFQFVSR